jgi:hypothetical protein
MLLPPMLRWPLLWWMLCCQCRLFSLFISSECFVATIVGGGSSHISFGVDAFATVDVFLYRQLPHR